MACKTVSNEEGVCILFILRGNNKKNHFLFGGPRSGPEGADSFEIGGAD